MNHRGFLRCAAAVGVLGGTVLGGGPAAAQDTAAQPIAGQTVADSSAANTSTLDEIVVTGSAQSAGLRKLDASFSITTASLEEIRDANPRARRTC